MPEKKLRVETRPFPITVQMEEVTGLYLRTEIASGKVNNKEVSISYSGLTICVDLDGRQFHLNLKQLMKPVAEYAEDHLPLREHWDPV